jgi:transcriptional regulator with XRE-family HTH domain
MVHRSSTISLRLRQVLARNVREARQKRGLAQEALALKVGLSATYVSQVESGSRNVTLETIQRLADGLGLPPWRLMHDDEVAGEEKAESPNLSGKPRG